METNRACRSISGRQRALKRLREIRTKTLGGIALNVEDSFAFAGEAMFRTSSNKGVSETELLRLMRRWHTLALQTATHCCGVPPKLSGGLLQLMWLVLAEGRITLKYDEPLRDVALIPRREYNRFRQGERSVLVGLIQESPKWERGQTAQLMLRGVDVDWPVVVSASLTRHGWKGRLCLVAAEYREGRWHSLRKPAVALLHPDGAVWLDSMLEWRMYEFLRSRKVQIEKPLRECPEWFGFKPSFVLPKESPPVVIEVWEMSNFDSSGRYDGHRASANRDYKENKRVVYRERGEKPGKLRFLEWDAQRTNDWDRFVASFDAVMSVKSSEGESVGLRNLTRPAGT